MQQPPALSLGGGGLGVDVNASSVIEKPAPSPLSTFSFFSSLGATAFGSGGRKAPRDASKAARDGEISIADFAGYISQLRQSRRRAGLRDNAAVAAAAAMEEEAAALPPAAP